MKKIILYASVTGLIIGSLIYLAIRKNKSIFKSKSAERKPDSFEKEPVSELGVEDEITDKKNSSAQSVHERHVKAADMMHRAFETIYNNTEPLEPDTKEESDVAEAVVTDNKLNSLSDELDDLLK